MKIYFNNFIFLFFISAYFFLILNSSMNIFDGHISAEEILFRGEFIKWLESSVVTSGRFVPFSNTFNILLFNLTDSILYFALLRLLIILLTFYFLKKIFNELNIAKYYIWALIIICYNHAFLNGQYITSFEGDIALLVTIIFYIDIKNKNTGSKIYENFIIIILMIFLLGLKESMFAFFCAYTFLKFFFYKTERIQIKIIYILILLIYLIVYYKITFINIDLNNLYGLQKNDADKFVEIIKISINYIVSFPLLFACIIFLSFNLFKNLFRKKNNKISIEEIYFVAGICYIGVYLILDLFAFRYVLPLYYILIPLTLSAYNQFKKNNYINYFVVFIFTVGPAFSNSIELINNYSSKFYNNKLNNDLKLLSNIREPSDIGIIYNFESNSKFLLENQKHDRNDFGNILLYFEDKNNFFIKQYPLNSIIKNKDYLDNKIIISLIKNDSILQKNLLQTIDNKLYNKSSYIRHCKEPILIKSILRANNCSKLITNISIKK